MIRVGLIGAGKMGEHHVNALTHLSDKFVLSAIYDVDMERAISVCSQSCKVANTVFELMACCDVVVVASPTETHFDYALQALRNSKHLFIEKPVACTVDEVKRLVRFAHEADVKVQIGHIERFNPAFVAAENLLVKPYLIQTNRSLKNNTPTSFSQLVLDHMLHDIDMVLHVVRQNIKRISATGYNVLHEYPDVVHARIEFDNGCVANLCTSLVSNVNTITSTVYQSGSVLEIDLINKTSKITMTSPVEMNQLEQDDLRIPITNEVSHFPESGLIQEYKALYNSILTDTKPIVSLEDGLTALDVATTIIDKLKVTALTSVDNIL
jgi:predicted dehydrogenase